MYLVDRQRRLSHLPYQPLRNFKGEEILMLLGAFPREDSLYPECVLACLHKHGGEPIIGKNLVDTWLQWPSKLAAGVADREMRNVVECEGSEAIVYTDGSAESPVASSALSVIRSWA